MFLFRWLKRIIKTIVWLIIIVVLIPIAGLAYGFLTTPSLDKTPLPGIADGAPPKPIADKVRAEIPGYQRPEESTFLTYPEWAIVYAAREYAGFVVMDILLAPTYRYPVVVGGAEVLTRFLDGHLPSWTPARSGCW